MVTALQVVFRSLALVVGGHRPVALENLALRQQLAAWTRSNRRPQLRTRNRLLWVCLASMWRGWRTALVVVHPDTVVRWHRQWRRRQWTRRSARGRSGRPRTAAANRTLVLTIPAGARAARTPSHAKSRRLQRLPGHPVQRSHPRADRRVGPAKRRPGDRRLTKGSVQRAEGISS